MRSQTGRRSRTPWRKPTCMRSGSTAGAARRAARAARRRSRTGSEPRTVEPVGSRTARRARRAPRPRGPPCGRAARARRGAATARRPSAACPTGTPRSIAAIGQPERRALPAEIGAPRHPARGRRRRPRAEQANSSASGCRSCRPNRPRMNGVDEALGQRAVVAIALVDRRARARSSSLSDGLRQAAPASPGGAARGLRAQHHDGPRLAPPGPTRSTRAHRVAPVERAVARRRARARVRHVHHRESPRPSASCAGDLVGRAPVHVHDAPRTGPRSRAVEARPDRRGDAGERRRSDPTWQAHHEVGRADPLELRPDIRRRGRPFPRPHRVRWASSAR